MIDINKNSFCISQNEKQFNALKQGFINYNIGIPELHDARHRICNTNHQLCIKKAIDRKLPYCIIFEEDAYPCYNIDVQKINNDINLFDKDWDIIILGYCGIGQAINFQSNENHYKHVQTKMNMIQNIVEYDNFFTFDDIRLWGSHAYIVNSRAYNNFLNSLNKYPPADIAITNYDKTLNVYISKINYFIQRNIVKNLWYFPHTMEFNNNYDYCQCSSIDQLPKQLSNYVKTPLMNLV